MAKWNVQIFSYLDPDLLNATLVSGKMWALSTWKVEISVNVTVCKLLSEHI